jgi:hypothetical protein
MNQRLRLQASLGCLAALLAASCGGSGGSGMAPGPAGPPPASNSPYWAQWAYSPRHDGQVSVAGQALTTQLADITYDPFVADEQAEMGGDLVAHYPSTLIDGADFYIEKKTGTYPRCPTAGAWRSGTACGPNAWNQVVWNVARYQWQGTQPVAIWSFASDWKPEPNGQGLNGWEPVFQPALANSAIYVPGAGGTLWKVDKTTGQSLAHIDPFAGTAVHAASAYVSGPITVDATGNLYYNVIELTASTTTEPWFGADVVSAWLVRVDPQGAVLKASYASLVPGAPAAGSTTCAGGFSSQPLPWPPAPSAVPPTQLCGSQRPGVNVAPAISPDGTIFTISRAHFDEQAGYVVAVNPDLSPKWQASLEHRLADGCGVLLPIATDLVTPNSCRPGTTVGVDPTTNALGSGSVTDQSSSTPTALPDGSVLYGAITTFNGLRGHLMKFTAQGAYAGSYGFGWDSTPAVYAHGGTYSIIIKDNHYGTSGLYCFRADPICQPLASGPYFITQLNANLQVEWQFQNTTIDASNPNGYEWCINAPAVDTAGTVYVNGEDGYLYAIGQGHAGVFTTPLQKRFLKLAIGAAYTPLSIGPDGRIYTQNDGHLFVVGS